MYIWNLKKRLKTLLTKNKFLLQQNWKNIYKKKVSKTITQETNYPKKQEHTQKQEKAHGLKETQCANCNQLILQRNNTRKKVLEFCSHKCRKQYFNKILEQVKKEVKPCREK